MSLRHYIFASEAEAQKCAVDLGSKAQVVYRGDYRNDWLVTIAD